MPILPPGIRAVLRPRSVRAEVDDEVAFHLRERIDALVARGWSVSDATAEARRRFGDTDATRDALAAQATSRERRLDMIDRIAAIRQDLRVAARQLRRSPSFAFGAIAAFALGIGANATMFNVLDRLLLRPPAHVRDPADVYTIRVPTRAHVTGGATSFPIFAALHDNLAGVASVAMQTFANPISIGRGADAGLAQSVLVDGGYFRTLGVSAALGRTLGDDDARLPAGQPVAVIGHGLWQRQFGGDPSVVGREIYIAAERVRIVGVAPEGFNGIGLRPIDIWLPVTLTEKLLFVGPKWSTSNLSIWLFTFARLAPGVATAQVESRATAAFLAVRERGASEGDLGSVELRSILPSSATTMTREARVASMLGAVSVLVLLIACANAANLMLARAVRRRREIGVRMALGGSHARIAAQLVTDALLLSALGGLAALAVAAVGSAFMRSILLEGYAWNGALVDARTLAFIALAVVVAGLLTGFVPAVLLRRFDLSVAIAEGRQAGGVHRHRMISTLVVAQTVLSVVLLIGAALFVNSLRAVRGVPLGVDAEHTVVIELDTKSLKLTDARADALFADLASRTARVPGVSSVAIAEGMPFGWSMGSGFSAPGIAADHPTIARGVNVSAVTSEYFTTIGTRIVDGQDFAPTEDRADGERVAVVSARLATSLWPSATAVGRCIKLGADSMPCVRVVGVAEETHASGIVEEDSPFPHVYVPLSQGRHAIVARAVVVRALSPERAMPLIRNVVTSLDATLPYPEIGVLGSRLDPELRPWRLGAIMFGAFGVLSLTLATLGLYSVIAYSVAQRRQEMGIRVALGARSAQILALIGREGGRLAVFGALVGVAAAAALAPLVQPLLFGTQARSVAIYAAVAVAMTLVALIACVVPALGAARTSPMVVIRSD